MWQMFPMSARTYCSGWSKFFQKVDRQLNNALTIGKICTRRCIYMANKWDTELPRRKNEEEEEEEASAKHKKMV